MSSAGLREARLVAVAVDGPDPRLAASTALPGGHDGVAHAAVRQPARAAVVQALVPGGVELSGGGQLRPVAQAVGLGLREGQALVGGAVEHLAFTEAQPRLLTQPASGTQRWTQVLPSMFST